MNKGNIGVTTENIFPVIKKFLYSDHDIFLREIVSNAVDATQKLKTIIQKGEMQEEAGDLTIQISVNKDKGTLTVSDKGIGMTMEEVDKYINQIAFSSANDFLDKYKEDANAIIGHFGLGFYSAFMVSKKVEVITKSWKTDSKGVKWSCDGSPEYEMDECDKAERGTDIIMYLDDDCKEFLDEYKLKELLNKYCHFLPTPIAFGRKKEWKTDKDGKNGKYVETDEYNIINDTTPIWTKKPSELKDEDYTKFYQDLYPMSNEPLFWIHLNVDFPFHLTGVLYFPKVRNQFELNKNKIQLYCNQVFVTSSVEGIVPEFLTLLHGVIDSPDIPLNVSRSYLQSDSNVKKISTYITKKVSDKLQSIFKQDRKQFEEKWDDIKIFIHYGMLSQEDFYDKAKGYVLLKDVDNKHFTLDEYQTLIKDQQTDKDGNLIYLYAQNKENQYAYIADAQKQGYSVLLLDGELDSAMLGLFEQKIEKCRFLRVDSDSIDRLINKSEDKDNSKDEKDKSPEPISQVFKNCMPTLDKTEFNVETRDLGINSAPVIITQSEYMRRMKDMARIQQGMAFYGDMPDMYNLILNIDHPLIQQVITSLPEKQDEESLKEFSNPLVNQLIDLALLQNGMLKGESLTNFIKRSIELMK
ncbi:MAG: molecular chaperone HtpG [Prevotellaceae bacterium]|nr:molecular chaperone HtpG [Candidatus Colivivens equi]